MVGVVKGLAEAAGVVVVVERYKCKARGRDIILLVTLLQFAPTMSTVHILANNLSSSTTHLKMGEYEA